MAVSALDLHEGWVDRPARPLWQRAPLGLLRFARRKPLGFFGLVVVVALLVAATPPFTDWIAPYGYAKQDLRNRLQAPSAEHWMGTDQAGRDVFSRIVYGARVSVVVGFGAVAISEGIAVLIGVVSGYYLGWFDRLFQRLVDVFQALPGLVVMITILGVFGSGLWQLVIVIGVLGGPPASRLIRGQVISLMNRPYVEAARVVGAGHTRIMVRHLLPNVIALVILGATLRIGAVVLAESTLSFLGYGLPPPFPSWGQMLALEGREYMNRAPWLAIYPGLVIGLTVYAFNILGDALRDVLDPRLRGGR
ncbi:MAG: ABC transporter permease [Dehalococcoidia bacterium]